MTTGDQSPEPAVGVVDALDVLTREHPLPWRAAELTYAEYWGDGSDGYDHAGDVAWCGVVDATGRPVSAFGYHPRGSSLPGEPDAEYVAVAAIVNAVGRDGTRTA